MKYENIDVVIKDSRYQDIGNLPSNFLPYKGSYDKLYIRPFSIKELRLISKAATLKDIKHQIRAVDLCISEDVTELSIGDYYYVLAWLRIHSYPKTPMVATWLCDEQVYKHKETLEIINNDDTFKVPENLSEYVTEPCNTHNSEIIHFSNLEIISLDDDVEPINQVFDFPRVKHLADIQECLKDPELRFIMPAAQWIAGATVEDKLKALDESMDLTLFDEASILNEKLDHGIKETMTIRCRRCLAAQPYTVALDPFSFFK